MNQIAVVIFIFFIFYGLKFILRNEKANNYTSIDEHLRLKYKNVIHKEIISSQRNRYDFYGIRNYYVVVEKHNGDIVTFNYIENEHDKTNSIVKPQKEYCLFCEKSYETYYEKCPDCGSAFVDKDEQ